MRNCLIYFLSCNELSTDAPVSLSLIQRSEENDWKSWELVSAAP